MQLRPVRTPLASAKTTARPPWSTRRDSDARCLLRWDPTPLTLTLSLQGEGITCFAVAAFCVRMTPRLESLGYVVATVPWEGAL
jgi:hypothetical protein